jgi:hypothetical protein
LNTNGEEARIRLVNNYTTRLRINTYDFGLGIRGSVLVSAMEQSKFVMEGERIVVGMGDVIHEPKPNVVFNHELYHYLSYLLRNQRYAQIAEQEKKMLSSIGSLNNECISHVEHVFLAVRNDIQGILDEAFVEKIRGEMEGNPGLISSDKEDERTVLLNILRNPSAYDQIAYGEIILFITAARSMLKDEYRYQDDFPVFYKKLRHYMGRPETVKNGLKLTLLFLCELYQDRNVRNLFTQLYCKILQGHVFPPCPEETKRAKKIEIVSSKSGNFTVSTLYRSMYPLQCINVTDMDDIPPEDPLPDTRKKTVYEKKGTFTMRSYGKFRTLRDPFERRVSIVTNKILDDPVPAVDTVRNVLMLLNPVNEMDGRENHKKKIVTEFLGRAVTLFETLKNDPRVNMVEVYMLHLGITYEPYTDKENNDQNGNTHINIDRVLGTDDWPDFDELIQTDRDLFHLLKGKLEHQFFTYHPDVKRPIIIMPRVFTDSEIFNPAKGHLNRIMLLSYHQFDPDWDYYPMSNRCLFTSDENLKKIEFEYVKECIRREFMV